MLILKPFRSNDQGSGRPTVCQKKFTILFEHPMKLLNKCRIHKPNKAHITIFIVLAW